MSELNGTLETAPENRIKTKSKSTAPKGSGAAFYDKMRSLVAKKKSVTVKADAEDATVTLSVKSLPLLTKSALTASARTSGCDTTVKPKGGVEGFDVTAKATFEGEHAEQAAEAFFGIEVTEKN